MILKRGKNIKYMPYAFTERGKLFNNLVYKKFEEKEILTIRIEPHIFTIRGKKVVIDSDLASLYGAQTKRLNEQVKRNAERFPEDFFFN